MVWPTDQETSAIEKIVTVPRRRGHTKHGPHEKASGTVRRQRGRGRTHESLYWGFWRKKARQA